MSDPRYSDPRYSQSRFRDPAGRTSGIDFWGWIVGLAVIALIAIFLIAGNVGSNHTASTGAPPVGATATAPMPHAPAATTGMSAPSPMHTPPAKTK